MAALYRIDHSVQNHRSLVVCIKARLFGHRLHRDEGSPGLGFLLPDLVHRAADFLEGVFKTFACKLLSRRIECPQIIWTAC